MTTQSARDVPTRTLTLPEELVLMLLNEENGYFHQVPGWALNCAIVGAALAELSLQSRIDTDMDSLFVVNATATGDPILDPILSEIAGDPIKRSAQYWVERLAPHAESTTDMTLDRLVNLNVLDHHDGDFWTLSRTAWQTELYTGSREGTAVEFVKTRIGKVILADEIPTPRDVIIIALINTCDVFRFILPLDDAAEERIHLVSRMDLIGRSIAAAVSHNLAGPLLRHSALSKKIPTVPLRKLLLSPHIRKGNLPALFAELTQEYGPVFQINPPFVKPMTFLAGPEANKWVHRSGRMYLRTKDYFADFEKVYGANGVLPSLDGADHFRLRKSLSSAYSRGRLEGQIDNLYRYIRGFMADWKVGDAYQATLMCRSMVNAQLSPLMLSVESQDLLVDLAKYKERALLVHIMKALPKFMLQTPGMRRRAKIVDILLERVQGMHTTAQRAGSARDLADDLLSLHASEPQFMPETNLRFALSAALVASVYLGDAFSFALYAMASQPELQRMIQAEADALFENGDPDSEDFTLSAVDVTHRFLMECLRVYPIVPMSIRNVMNSCMVEGYEIPVGTRLYIGQSAAHYMPEVFPDPYKFDIDRYLPPRNEHHNPGYAPFGLGTHTCLGSQWMNLQLTINVLMVAHYFTLGIAPANYKLKINPIPSLKPSSKLKFRIAEQRREINV
ncbi:MAG: cytochrome P450 [Chloroflexi bacterium]|nr:cytochrome P450 [Chloroflexota bacterium]